MNLIIWLLVLCQDIPWVIAARSSPVSLIILDQGVVDVESKVIFTAIVDYQLDISRSGFFNRQSETVRIDGHFAYNDIRGDKQENSYYSK
jgi:hypothetical protein